MYVRVVAHDFALENPEYPRFSGRYMNWLTAESSCMLGISQFSQLYVYHYSKHGNL